MWLLALVQSLSEISPEILPFLLPPLRDHMIDIPTLGITSRIHKLGRK